MFKRIIIILSLFSVTGYANVFKPDDDRVINIRGVIDGHILISASQLEKLANDNKKPVSIIINSPGGAVLPGVQFVSAMRIAKSRGVKLRCFVPVIAASMAMIIFNECNERYALDNALFLWHSIRVGLRGVYTPEDLEPMRRQMIILQQDYNQRMIKNLRISNEVFYYYYRNEMLLPATYLKDLSKGYIKIVRDAEGVARMFDL
jgi:ATP-dependent protease ClpP protease subunit